MAIWNRHEKEAYDDAESPTKQEYDTTAETTFYEGEVGNVEEEEVALHRGLKARHITMIGMHAKINEKTFSTGKPATGFKMWTFVDFSLRE